MPRDADDLLRDIREACRRIAGYVEGHDLQTFTSDDRTIRAVLYDLVVIGEAAKGVDDATRAAHPNVPWKEMAGLRDIAVHQYHRIMLDLVWDTATRRVPDLLASLG